MDFVHNLETEYGRPAKDFIAQSFRECPTITLIGVVFSAISFVPVVSTIALALIVCFLATIAIVLAVVALVSGALFVVFTLALLLSTILSAAFALSAITALVMSGVVRCRTPRAETQEAVTTAPANCPGSISTYLIPVERAFTALQDKAHALGLPFRLPGFGQRRSRLFALILLRNPLARIFLPRWMRYRYFFPWVFGLNRTPHPLKWVILRGVWAVQRSLSPVFKAVSFLLVKLPRLAYRLLADMGWDSVLIVCVLVVLLSPRVYSVLRALSSSLWAKLKLGSWKKEKKEAAVETRVVPDSHMHEEICTAAIADEEGFPRTEIVVEELLS